MAVIRGIARDLIQTKKAQLERGEKLEDHDILSTAIESGMFPDENLIDQVMTFLAAGHESTSLFYFLRHRKSLTLISDRDCLDMGHLPHVSAPRGTDSSPPRSPRVSAIARERYQSDRGRDRTPSISQCGLL